MTFPPCSRSWVRMARTSFPRQTRFVTRPLLPLLLPRLNEKNLVTIDAKNQSRAILSVGNEDWPLPVPIIKQKGKWHFDSKQGRDEILFRRIGANELDAIQVCRGFVEAQEEYASQVHDDSGVNQYAQRIISTPGKRDGLYWKNEDGTPGGPISEGIARAIEEGYSPVPLGAIPRLLLQSSEGAGSRSAAGTTRLCDQWNHDRRVRTGCGSGRIRVTGVKTFIVSYDGVVYEKDLGPDSLNLVKNMERYNPDKTWHRTDDQWPTDSLASVE